MAKSSFKLYDCKVRLAGSVLNEVPKDGLTANDIEMYRALHGADAVVAIVETGKAAVRSDLAERRRLQATFLNPVMDGPERLKAKTEMFRNLFGHDSLPMPKELVAVDEVDDDEEVVGDEETEIVDAAPAPPVRRTRAPRATVPATAEASALE